MPELPEVETIRRGLIPALEGRRLVRVIQRRPDLRVPFPERFAERLTGRRVAAIRRRAKYLLFHLDDGAVLIVHLGMSGRMVVAPAVPDVFSRHDHVVFVTETGTAVVFNDARRFGLMALADEAELAVHPLLCRLGPEPLDPAFTGAVLAERLAGRPTPIKMALLDQTVVAGLGNIYASEALFAAELDPTRPASQVVGETAIKLAAAIRDVLERAVAAGGSSLRDYVNADGGLGYFQYGFAVYGRQGRPCPGCSCDLAKTGGVRRMVQGGRATFFCQHRQR